MSKVFLRTILILAGGLLPVFFAGLDCAMAGSPWRGGYFPNTELTDQNGRKLRFYDDVLKDQIVVISFIFTSCQDICPISTARLVQVQDELTRVGYSKVRFISLTVDPEVDTPERLKAFSKGFNTGPNWVFLTGKPEDIRAINRKLGDRSTKPSEHRNEIVLGNETTGEWARGSAFLETGRLAIDILQMDPAWRNTTRDTASDNDHNAITELSGRPGEALFRKVCAPCHTVGVGDRIGPDLRDVTERRSETWLKAFIESPSTLQKQGDPDAQALAARFPAVVMPELGLSDQDVADLVSFLRDSSRRITAASTDQQHDHAARHQDKDDHEHKM
jgi:protein SCO1